MAELTAAQGYAGTRIADVVRRAAVARKTLYDNFESKEELLLAALDAYLGEMRREVESAGSRAGTAVTRIEAGLSALVAYVVARPGVARLCLIESISATPASARRRDAAVAQFASLLEAAVPAGTALPPSIADALVGGVAWILQRQIRRDETELLPELLPQLSAFLLSRYRSVP